jgi:hypothetical protein
MSIFGSVKKKDLITGILHTTFNLTVVALSLTMLLLFPDTPWAAIGVVLLSKWRTFAVRPRFWAPNVLANLTDFIFCTGLVILMWQAGIADMLWLQIVYCVIYAAWLIVLKPMSKPLPVLLQAGISQFVALTALFAVADYLTLPVVVAGCFAIGFAISRHVLLLHKEQQYTLFSLIWGLVLAELGFVAYHWSVTYAIADVVQIPQMALIATALALAVERFYDSFRRHAGQIKFYDVIWSTLFATLFIAVTLLFFGGLFDASNLL